MMRIGFQNPLRFEDLVLPVALLAVFLMGGGAWGVGTLAICVLGIGWMGLLLVWPGVAEPTRRVAVIMALAWALLALWQLVPLPAAFWNALPGRGELARARAAAGLPPGSMAWTLDVRGAVRSLLVLGAVLPLLPLVTGASRDGLRWTLRAWTVLAVVSVFLGAAQWIGGPTSPLRLHAFFNREGALGFFANRNHQAAWLLMSLPVATAVGIDALHRRQRLLAASSALACVALLAGLAMAGSRAGWLLGFGLGFLCTTWAARAAGLRRGQAIAFLLAGAAVAAAVAWMAWPQVSARLHEGLVDHARLALYRESIAAGMRWQPWGAGLGAYEQAFQASHANAALLGAYVHHAHNDALQVWFELGWPGVLVLLGLLGVLIRAAWRVWSTSTSAATVAQSELLWGRAASLALPTVGLQSMVDYTFRNVATLGAAVCLTALLIDGRKSERQARVEW